MKFQAGGGGFDRKFGGGHLAHRAGFAEEREFLFQPVNQVAVLLPHHFVGGHAADFCHRVVPRADGSDVGCGGVGAGDAITLELSCTDTGIDLVLVDPGKPFDLRTAALDGALPRRGGGAGLKLIRAWASHVDYRTSDGLNRLTLRLGEEV